MLTHGPGAPGPGTGSAGSGPRPQPPQPPPAARPAPLTRRRAPGAATPLPAVSPLPPRPGGGTRARHGSPGSGGAAAAPRVPHGRCRRYRGSTMARPPPALRTLPFFWALSFLRPPLARLQSGRSEFRLGGENPQAPSGGGGGREGEEGRLLGLAAQGGEGGKIAGPGRAPLPQPRRARPAAGAQPLTRCFTQPRRLRGSCVKKLREALPRAVVKSRYGGRCSTHLSGQSVYHRRSSV